MYFIYISYICIHLREIENNLVCVHFQVYVFQQVFLHVCGNMRVNQGEEFILQFLMNLAHNHFMFLQVVTSFICSGFSEHVVSCIQNTFPLLYNLSLFQGNSTIVENCHAWERRKGRGGKSPTGVLQCQETADH